MVQVVFVSSSALPACAACQITRMLFVIHFTPLTVMYIVYLVLLRYGTCIMDACANAHSAMLGMSPKQKATGRGLLLGVGRWCL